MANYSKKNGTSAIDRHESHDARDEETAADRAHAHRMTNHDRPAYREGVRSNELVIEHGTDAYKVARELADAKVPVVHGPWIKVRGNLEQSGRVPESPRLASTLTEPIG